MRLKNEIFAAVFDWLVENKGVVDQKDLAVRTKINQNTISRIMTGKVEPKDDTLRKLNAAFGNIFNMAYLRGTSPIMLVEDVAYYMTYPEKNPLIDTPKKDEMPTWADNMIDIMAKQIKENETLHRQLQQSILEFNTARVELNATRTELEKLLYRLKSTDFIGSSTTNSDGSLAADVSPSEK